MSRVNHLWFTLETPAARRVRERDGDDRGSPRIAQRAGRFDEGGARRHDVVHEDDGDARHATGDERSADVAPPRFAIEAIGPVFQPSRIAGRGSIGLSMLF